MIGDRQTLLVLGEKRQSGKYMLAAHAAFLHQDDAKDTSNVLTTGNESEGPGTYL